MPRKTTGKKVSRTKPGNKTARRTAKKSAARSAKKGARRARGRAGYSSAERARILADYQAKRTGGMKAADAARAVGVSYLTLNRWEKAAGKPAGAKPGRKPGRKPKTQKAASKTGRIAKPKLSGAYTLTIDGQGTKITQQIGGDLMAQVVKMIF